MENLWKSSPGQSVQIIHHQAYTRTYKYKEEGGYNIAIHLKKVTIYKTTLRGYGGV